MLDPDYVRGRAGLIGERAGDAPPPGRMPGLTIGEDATLEAAGTSHFVVVDFSGNVVSITTTVEFVFGSGRTVAGFVLNNQLTDFSFRPADESGRPVANAVQGGKRPRSSMAPVIVLDGEGHFVAALGSPGGCRSSCTAPRPWWGFSRGASRCRPLSNYPTWRRAAMTSAARSANFHLRYWTG